MRIRSRIIKEYKDNQFTVVIRKIKASFNSAPWYTVYINSDKFLDKLNEYEIEALVNCHGGVTWVDEFPENWGNCSLTGKSVIGWDYAHPGDDNITLETIIAETTETLKDLRAKEKGELCTQ